MIIIHKQHENSDDHDNYSAYCVRRVEAGIMIQVVLWDTACNFNAFISNQSIFNCLITGEYHYSSTPQRGIRSKIGQLDIIVSSVLAKMLAVILLIAVLILVLAADMVVQPPPPPVQESANRNQPTG